jgi:hypothetical protein
VRFVDHFFIKGTKALLVIVDKLCIKWTLLRCNNSRCAVPRQAIGGLLPTMVPQLSQLPKIVGSGARQI